MCGFGFEKREAEAVLLFFVLWPLIVIGYVLDSVGRERPSKLKMKKNQSARECVAWNGLTGRTFSLFLIL